MLELIIFLVLMALGYGFGQWHESHHYKSIVRREQVLNAIPAIAAKKIGTDFPSYDSRLVAGNVVISVDYFKQVLAGLRAIFGGRISSYETLIDRARREAVLRMKQEAKRINAEIIFNIKMETSSISKGKGDSIGSVEVLAYGTALVPPRTDI